MSVLNETFFEQHIANYLADSPLYEQRTATDGTDAFDTLYIGAEKFPYRESYAFPTTGIL